MTPAPGRDQQAPMERMVRLIGLLGRAERGVPLRQLLDVVVPPSGHETAEARRRALNRVIEQLNLLGYDVRNVAPEGAEAHYVMRARDNRLQVHLSAEQRGELLRAALSAGLDTLAPHLRGDPPAGGGAQRPAARATDGGPALDLVQRATTRHCLVRFEYKGEPRLVHPVRVHSGPSGWYLAGREDGQSVVKEFVVRRMSGVALDEPGTALPVAAEPRPSLDPLSWPVDPPTEVVVATPLEQQTLVTRLLGTPAAVDVTARPGAEARLTYVVTNRAVFRLRLYELGTRVSVVSPDDVRREIVEELAAYVAAATPAAKAAEGGAR